MFFKQIVDPGLAQHAYLIGCERTRQAVVIDPERDVDRYLAIARREGYRIVAAAETHIHADFLSGCRELVERHRAAGWLSGEGGPGWQYEWAERHDRVTLLRHDDRARIGQVEFRVLHTPGHTPEHISFLVTDRRAGIGDPMGIVSGDFIFVGDLGRPDLLESAAGESGAMVPSAKRLYASARGILELPDYLRIWPGHGAGSACGKALGQLPDTTLGYEKLSSPAIAAVRRGEDAFVDFILEGQSDPPLYFGRMKRENRTGPALLGPLPEPARTPSGALAQMGGRADTAILDTRIDRAAFCRRHLPGAIHAPLNRTFTTIAGCYVEPSERIVLVCDEAQVEEAVRALVRIGLDRVEGWAPSAALDEIAAAGGGVASIEAIDFAEARRRPNGAVLDVRQSAEYAAAAVAGAAHAPHTRLAERLRELPRDRELMVHCMGGARATSAASYLAREGFRVAAVHDLFQNANAN